MGTSEEKIQTYLGFCLKAGKIALGLDRMEKLKAARLILYDGALSENSKRKAERLAEKFGCKVLVFEGASLEETLRKTGCKAAAVTDGNLAGAVLETAKNSERFKVLRGVEVGGNK